MNNLTKYNFNDKLSTSGVLMIEKESLKIHFGGKDSIDIETLRDALDATLKSLKVIADKNLKKEDHCKFIIENVQKGSFEIIISVVKDIIPEIDAAVGISAGIVTIFTGIAAFRKFLKGRNPKKIEDKENGKEVTNYYGDVTFINCNTLDTYVSDDEIEKSFARMSKTISKDGDRTTLVIEEYDADGKLKESVEYNKEELTQTSNAIEVEKLTDDYEIQEFKSTALIKRPCFSGDAKWELRITVLDRIVNVSVDDSDFLEKVQKGDISFSAATRIEAKFESKTRLDKSGDSNGLTRYSLKKVLSIKEGTQTKQMSIDDIEIN